MRYSQSTELGVESLLFMAAHRDRNDISVSEVAEAQQVSPSYLAKIFQQMVKAGILRSHRGAKGGYYLGKDLDEISLLDVVRVFEGTSPLFECEAVRKNCRASARCLIVNTFHTAEQAMNDVLQNVTIGQVAREMLQHQQGAPRWLQAEETADTKAD